MAGTLNDEEFEGAQLQANLRRAMGVKPDGKSRIGGIFTPEMMKLPPGEVIYRFGNKLRSVEDDRSGSWWVLRSTLALNAEHAPTVDSLLATLRQNLALPPAFSAMDRMFSARVRQRLTVFAGNGSGIWRKDLKRDDREGAPPLLIGGTERDGSARSVSLHFQLFIPGLARSAKNALDFAPTMTAQKWFTEFRIRGGDW